MHENELSFIIIKHSIEIHKEYGPGLLESFYEELLYNRLINEGIPTERQKIISMNTISNQNKKAFRIDLVVDEKVIVEVKNVNAFADIHKSQILTYLKITNIKLGLLINFNKSTLKQGIKRVVNRL
jgi:GxxExxY protein